MGLVLVAIAVMFVTLAFLVFWRCYFLRLPKRSIPKGTVVVSPANGRIVGIIPIKGGTPKKARLNKGILGRVAFLVKDTLRDGFLVSIMLTPLDVHYQRAPIDGKIVKVKYTKGAFKNAVIAAGKFVAIENEKNEILIQGKRKQKVKVVQIAGAVARRISCFVRVGQFVKKGEVIGLINLGSQVSLIVPGKKIFVKVNDKVIDGETMIAK